ncbi:MAG: lytic transglycosylase domain-containing protein [Nanoarchaeota archaeon]|nr:lytic transglycosylase domain-containing protein [Nanoarchaeota archaeon]
MKKEKHPIMRDSFRSLSIESKRKRKGPSSRWKYAFWPAFIALSLGITDYISRPSKNLSNHITKYEKTAALERISDQPSLGLNKDEWDEYAFISKYRDTFRKYAEKYGQPPSLAAGVIYQESNCRRIGHDLEEKLSVFLHNDESVGPGQILVSTAMFLDGVINSQSKGDFEKTTQEQRVHYFSELRDPEKNIEYVIKYLSYLLNVDENYKKKNTPLDELRKDKKRLALTAMRFSKGIAVNEVGFYGSNVKEAMEALWMRQLFPEDFEMAGYILLEEIVNSKESQEIKKGIGEGISLYELANYDSACKRLDFSYKEAMEQVDKLEWGRGKEYFQALAIVSLMYEARCKLDKGDRTSADLTEAMKYYIIAEEIRYGLDKAKETGISIPTMVANPMSGKNISVADYTLIQQRMNYVAKELIKN